MGVTEVRPYFMHIIGHTSINVNQIPTKLGTEIHDNEPFTCAKFSLIGAHIGVLWWILQSVRKEEGKKTNKLK